MRKIFNVLLISLLFCSIFGVIDFELNTQLVSGAACSEDLDGHTICTPNYVSPTANFDGLNHRIWFTISSENADYYDNNSLWNIYYSDTGYSARNFFYFRTGSNPGFVKSSATVSDNTFIFMYNAPNYMYELYHFGFSGRRLSGMTLDQVAGLFNGAIEYNKTTGLPTGRTFTGSTWSELATFLYNPYITIAQKNSIIISAQNIDPVARDMVTNKHFIEMPCDTIPAGYTTDDLYPTCGDGTCNGDETCVTCEADCGSCYSGTVTNTLTPSAVLTGETVNGVVILTDGISRQKPNSVTLTVNGASLVTRSGPTTGDDNFTHYEFVPSDTSLGVGDHVITAVANYNGTDYIGTATLIVSPPGEGTPAINPGAENSITQDGLMFTFNFTKEIYELNEEGHFVYVNVEKLSGISAPIYKYFVTLKTPDGQAGGGFTNYEAFNLSSINVKVGANSGTMEGTVTVMYNLGAGFSGWKEVTLTDTATIGTVSNNPGAIAEDNKTLAQKVLEAPKKALDYVATTAVKALSAGYKAVKGVAGDAYDGAKTVASDVAEAVSSPAQTVWKAITDTGKGIVTLVTGGSSGGFSLSGLLNKTLMGIPILFVVIGVVAIILLRRD